MCTKPLCSGVLMSPLLIPDPFSFACHYCHFIFFKYGRQIWHPPSTPPLPSPGSSKPTQILEWTIICISGHHLNTSPYRILPIFVFFGVLDSVIICFQLFLPSGRSAWVGRSVGSRRRVSKSCAPKIFLPKTSFWEKIGGA